MEVIKINNSNISNYHKQITLIIILTATAMQIAKINNSNSNISTNSNNKKSKIKIKLNKFKICYQKQKKIISFIRLLEILKMLVELY